MSQVTPDSEMEVVVPIRLPDLGCGDQQTTISVWWIEVGETLVEGESLVEVTFPGVTCTVSAPFNGKLLRICAPRDAVVGPGTVLGYALPETA